MMKMNSRASRLASGRTMHSLAWCRNSAIYAVTLVMLTLGMYSPRGNAQDITETTKLRPNDYQPRDYFGLAVDMVEHIAVVGSGRVSDTGDRSGAAYVFARGQSGWSQQVKLEAGDGRPDDHFGRSVAVDWGDAWDTVVVGNPDSDGGPDPDFPGSVYIYVWDGTAWSLRAELMASDGRPDDLFGLSVAISGDTVVVGSPGADNNDNESGAAYIFKRDGTTWTQRAKLTAIDAEEGDRFGGSVAISNNTTIVGAAREGAIGAAYVFTRDGASWMQQAKLTPAGHPSCGQFGQSVAISGNTAVVGSQDSYCYFYTGAAYIFIREGNAWSQQARLTDWDYGEERSLMDNFGHSVDINGDTVIVGIPGDNPDDHHADYDTAGPGAASVFTRDGTTWTHRAKLVGSDITMGEHGGYIGNLGQAVSLSGNTVFAGDVVREAVYVFRLPEAVAEPGDQP